MQIYNLDLWIDYETICLCLQMHINFALFMTLSKSFKDFRSFSLVLIVLFTELVGVVEILQPVADLHIDRVNLRRDRFLNLLSLPVLAKKACLRTAKDGAFHQIDDK